VHPLKNFLKQVKVMLRKNKKCASYIYFRLKTIIFRILNDFKALYLSYQTNTSYAEKPRMISAEKMKKNFLGAFAQEFNFYCREYNINY